MTFYIPKKALLMCATRLRVTDVFATSLYTGNGGTQTITNGLDLAGKGGLVWLKSRSTPDDHYLYDTSRGAGLALKSQSTQAEENNGRLSAFLSNGFTLNSPSAPNQSGVTNVAWTWREARKFFVKLTYTGNGQSGRQIPHGLGDVPGMIVVKARTSSTAWRVYHRGTGSGTGLILNTTAGANSIVLKDFGTGNNDGTGVHVPPTASAFTVGGSEMNDNGVQYVAYLFAHNPDLIDCGSYVGNGNANGPSVKCGSGWNPQFLLIKNTAASASYSYWMMLDTARTPGLSGTDEILRANTSESQLTLINVADLTGTGFKLATNDPAANQSNSTFAYLAIRSPT